VVVYTTTARDYLTWAPHFPPGTTREDEVVVHRFHADAPDPGRSGDLVRALALGGGDAAAERAWALAQGPVAPGMLAALSTTGARHEVVALWTYLYATTQLSMPLVADRAVLVPLAHDEPMFRFALTRGLVAMARGFAFLTPEERDLVDDLHGLGERPRAIVGAGIDAAVPGSAAAARRRIVNLPDRFVLYVGRVDPSKGLGALIRAHAAHRAAGGRCGLVLAGRPTGAMHLPDWVVTTGFVDEATRSGLLDACEAVVLPSAHESLSLVALEAWRARRPTLGNAASEVLAGQTARSGGGLLYTDAATYGRQLARLEADAALRERLGGAGAEWTAGHGWDSCVRRWRALLAQVRRPLSPT
jgi:glycosyltransferase involved in cell wall biosynthesis